MNRLYSLRVYARLLRLHQPIGSFLLLWPTLWALWIAGHGHPSAKLVFLFILGTFLMRSMGCIANDIADRQFDRFVMRTKNRPLATGEIEVKKAIVLLLFLACMALGIVLQLNLLTIKLALVGLALTCIYPYMKRFTYWPQGILGLTFSWGIPMAFAAQQNAVPKIAWLLYMTAALWPLAYDTIYAMVDREDDQCIGIKSTAIFLGEKETLFIALLQCAFVALLALLGFWLKLHAGFYLMLSFAGGLLVYQHYLIKDRKPDCCFKAFLNNAWVGGILFLGFFLGLCV
jgi:4-hydroxybenzoate polyprenyltransferase